MGDQELDNQFVIGPVSALLTQQDQSIDDREVTRDNTTGGGRRPRPTRRRRKNAKVTR